MALDFKKEADYLKQIRSMAKTLEESKELFDDEKLREFQQITKSLESNIEIAGQQARKLSIGIIGAMKAGKSSFLNACIFDGKPLLPKAATPMTAALTKITYSETPNAKVHFYTTEDWEQIKEDSAQYEKKLRDAYQSYRESQIRLAEAIARSGEYCAPVEILQIEEYETSTFWKSGKASERERGAVELTRMAKNHEIINKLGSVDMIEGDVIDQLNDYVGAGGTYTPIVSYVELQINSPDLKDLEIVDTPGLNDPIVSRTIATKQFLRSCDVVLLLSPCGSFMDANTIRLMSKTLPSSGVREVIVIGSKLDSGILNESSNDFPQAYNAALSSYRKRYVSSLQQVKSSGEHSILIEKLKKTPPESLLFVSSRCFTIAKKRKSGEPLDEEEELTLNNFWKHRGFEEKTLISLGGINKVKAELNRVLGRKEEIIEGKNSSLLIDAVRAHASVLDSILQEIVSSRTQLETSSADELRKRSQTIRDTIDSSREKLRYLFDGAAVQCEAKITRMRPELTKFQKQHRELNVNSKSHDEREEVKTGFLGLIREQRLYTVTDHEASASDVVRNLQEYAPQCLSYVNDEFQQIFNKEQFAQSVKDVVLDAFRKSGKDFDPDDVLYPLRNMLDQISIPHIDLDYTRFIDEVEGRYKEGVAKNEDIHQLEALQTRLLNEIEIELGKQLLDGLSKICTTLKNQGVQFADGIENKLCGELEKLQGQVNEREKYIAAYQTFADTVRSLKKKASAFL